MKKLILLSCLMIWCLRGMAQKRFFDQSATQALVWRNKKDYNDNEKGRKNQEVSTIEMTKLKATGDKCKQVFDYLDDKVSKVFIVIADAYTAKHIYESLTKTYGYQSEIEHWVLKKPWLGVVYYNSEATIINDVRSLVSLISMCVVTYGQISKMSVANRRIVYAQISQEMSRIEFKSMSLASMCQMAAYGQDLKRFKILQPYFNDKEAIDDVIKVWKD